MTGGAARRRAWAVERAVLVAASASAAAAAALFCLSAAAQVAATDSAAGAPALTAAELKAIVERRYGGDRTGACLAVAVVDRTTVSAYACADPAAKRPLDDRTAFEIGSVTKTMTAALLAERIAQGKLSLDDPLAKLLPADARVPAFEKRPITLAHLVTHTSGLVSFPPSWRPARPDNPYASLTTNDLFGALAATQLAQAPGTNWQYSNFAMMLLSLGLARDAGTGFEALLAERLFAPLGMRSSFVARKPDGVQVAAGHLPTRRPASPWDFPVDMAGAGGVRSTLPDMVRYVEALLGRRESAITPALLATQKDVLNVGGRRMAMNWIVAPVKVANEMRWIHLHEGGTGGFSAIVAFDRERGRGVVVLSDTMVISTGGLGNLAIHLLDSRVPLAAPRKAVAADPKKLETLAGRYRLDFGPGLGMELRNRDGRLWVQADGQPEFELGHDNVGDFYVLAFDAVLRLAAPGEAHAFIWLQGGGVARGFRVPEPR